MLFEAILGAAVGYVVADKKNKTSGAVTGAVTGVVGGVVADIAYNAMRPKTVVVLVAPPASQAPVPPEPMTDLVRKPRVRSDGVLR